MYPKSYKIFRIWQSDLERTMRSGILNHSHLWMMDTSIGVIERYDDIENKQIVSQASDNQMRQNACM